MNDEAQSELLDAEFRQILYVIKPLICKIDNQHRLERYRIWLERLSAVHQSERRERNKYLLALANQIHDGILNPPFTHIPPQGCLPPLKKMMMIPSDEDLTRISEHFFEKETGEWPYIKFRRSEPVDQQSTRPAVAKENAPRKRLTKANPKMVQPFKRIGKTCAGQDERTTPEGSWCDLSDTTQGDTDREEEKKKLSTHHKNEGLKLQEHFIKKYVDHIRSSSESAPCQEKKSKKTEVFSKHDDKVKKETKRFAPVAQGKQETKIRKTCGEDNFEPTHEQSEDVSPNTSVASIQTENKTPRPTEQELEALKMRMRDLLEVKYALRDTHCLTEDRRKTVDALHFKVARLEQQNAELQALLDAQKKKCLEVDQVKNKEMGDFKEKFSLLRQKEIECLNQYHKKEITVLEKSYSTKIAELEAKIAIIKKEYEEKIKLVTDSSMNVVKQKDCEIEKLQSELKTRASQLANEGNGEQIICLKRCISKLDKILHKNEKDYVKKIERLRQELEVKDMTSQMQLQTQRADLIVRNAAIKQEELKSALNSLEVKYKKMIETLQIRALDAKKQDDKLIEELKTLLDRNNISYMFST